jgi:hypothetical protein
VRQGHGDSLAWFDGCFPHIMADRWHQGLRCALPRRHPRREAKATPLLK